LQIKSLEIDDFDFDFLDGDGYFPILKTLIGNNIDLTKLSKALNEQKLPNLEELILNHSHEILFNRLKLKNPIRLKRLSLLNCSLKNLSPLTKLLTGGKMPDLEVLDLTNNKFQLETLRLDKNINLKELKLDTCGLTDISILPEILSKIPKLELLNFGSNYNIQWHTFQLKKPIYLKSLSLDSCHMTDLTHLAKILNDGNMPLLEVLNLGGNDIELSTFELKNEISSLKHLYLNGCHLKNISPLNMILKKMPNLEKLDLSNNWNIQLDTLDETTTDFLEAKEALVCRPYF
jgi:hypothetical protein